MTAARCDGKCAPLSHAYDTTHGIADKAAAVRGTRAYRSSRRTSIAMTPRCKPAVTSTCTVPVA
jgi:hypothetical protein